MNNKQYSLIIRQLCLLISVFGGITNLHAQAYENAHITNNTLYTVTGKVNYVSAFCSNDDYTVKPGATWKATNRGVCLISSITGKANGKSIQGEPTGIADYDPDIATSYSRFQIEAYNGGQNTGYRIYSKAEFKKETAGSNQSPGFYFVNKTDWPIAFRIDQAGCLYHGVIPVRGSIRRSTGAVWFTLGFNIQPDGVDPVNVGEDCILPVAEIVADVALTALTGGTAAAGKAALKTIVKQGIKKGLRSKATKTFRKKGTKLANKIIKKHYGKILKEKGRITMIGQYAGYDWPFRCSTQPTYEITGGPKLTLDKNGSHILADAEEVLTVKRKGGSCGNNMMPAGPFTGKPESQIPFTTADLWDKIRSTDQSDSGIVIEMVEDFEPSDITSWPPKREDNDQPYAYADKVDIRNSNHQQYHEVLNPTQIAAGYNGDVWMLGASSLGDALSFSKQASIFHWNKVTQLWDKKTDTKAARIAVGPLNNAWILDKSGVAFEWSPSESDWKLRGSEKNTFTDIDIGKDGSVWALSGKPQSPSLTPTIGELYKWQSGNWITVDKATAGEIPTKKMKGWRLAVDPLGNPWVADGKGNIQAMNYKGEDKPSLVTAVTLSNPQSATNIVLDIDIGFNERDENNNKIEVYYTYTSCEYQYTDCDNYARRHIVSVGNYGTTSNKKAVDILNAENIKPFEFKPNGLGFDDRAPSGEVSYSTQIVSSGNGKYWFIDAKENDSSDPTTYLYFYTNDASNYNRESRVAIDSAEITVAEESGKEVEVMINLSRTGVLDTVTIPMLFSGSADEEDYSVPTKYIKFQEGATSTQLLVKILEDSLYEPGSPETLVIEVGSRAEIYGIQNIPDVTNNSKIINIIDTNWPKPTQFPVKVPMSASEVDVSIDGTVWILGTEPSAANNKDLKIYRWERESQTARQEFVQMPGGATKIGVAPSGNAWIVNASGKVFEWDNGSFISRGSIGASDIDVGADGSVVAVVDAGRRLKKWNGSSWEYLMPEGTGFVYQGFTVSSDGTPYVTKGDGLYCRVFYFKTDNQAWGCGQSNIWEFDTGAQYLQYILRNSADNLLNGNRTIWSRQQPNGDYTELKGAATKIASAGREAYWYINKNNELWTTDAYNFWNLAESVDSIPTEEREALENLFYATGGENWTNNANWLGAVGTECNWYGVICNDGEVIGLELNYNNLTGTLPESLQNLASLNYLYISHNALEGSVPSWLLDLNIVLEYSHGFKGESGDLDFKFTIENSEGNVDGQITGEVRGLVDNKMGQIASSVILDSWPDDLVGEPANGNNLTGWQYQDQHSFDVVNGMIVDARFHVHDEMLVNQTFNWMTFAINSTQDTNCCGIFNNLLTFDSDWTVTGNADGFAGVKFTPLSAPQPRATDLDANADGKADIVWRNSKDGRNWLWTMNGRTVTKRQEINTISSQQWKIVGRGDFDGDLKSDIFWRNYSSGRNYMYLMDGSNIKAKDEVNYVSDIDWQVKGVGDFDGDGKDDVIWRHVSRGDTYIYLMDGMQRRVSKAVLKVKDLDWQIKAKGDVNGDGKDDIIWRHSTRGTNYVWLMDGSSIASRYVLNTVNTNWDITGAGDIDGDGTDDILWRNSADGRNWAYLMQDGRISTSKLINKVSSKGWYMATIGDFDGDGKADIYWRNQLHNKTYFYLMDGLVIREGEYGENILREWLSMD